MKYKIFVFDFDGTLVKSNEVKYDLFFEVTNSIRYSRKYLNQILKNNPQLTRTEVFEQLSKMLLKYKGVRVDHKALVAKYTEMSFDKIVGAEDVSGARSTLDYLKSKGGHLYISSNTPEEPLSKIILNKYGNGVFEGIYGAPATKVDHLNDIYTLTGIEKTEFLYIGDSKVDYDSAKKFGCGFIGIDLGRETRFSQKPSVVLKDLDLVKNYA